MLYIYFSVNYIHKCVKKNNTGILGALWTLKKKYLVLIVINLNIIYTGILFGLSAKICTPKAILSKLARYIMVP